MQQLSPQEAYARNQSRVAKFAAEFRDPALHQRAERLNLRINMVGIFLYTITGRADSADRKWRRRIWPAKKMIDSDPGYDNGPVIRMRRGDFSLFGAMDSLERTARKDMGVFR